jgi:thiamine pyrophosphate-dependent acetolactate synthase large subunit-like protein
LFVSSACYDTNLRAVIEQADAVLCVGTELGSETTFEYELGFGGPVVQVDVVPERIGAVYRAQPVVGDAKAALAGLVALLPEREEGQGGERAAEARECIRRGVSAFERELRFLRTIEQALPRGAVTAWDMTIMAYNASMYFQALEPRRFLYPLGSGTLGYAWPAALGARLAVPDTPVLATVGDGGIQYGLAELAVARQYDIDAKLLVVDDGAYGVLKLYQAQSFGEFAGVDLAQPSFSGVASAFGVPVREASADTLSDDLAWAMERPGPAVVVLRTEVALIEA